MVTTGTQDAASHPTRPERAERDQPSTAGKVLAVGNDGRITLHAPQEHSTANASNTHLPLDRRPRVHAALRAVLDEPPGLELTSSCTHAMEAAARLLGIGPADEVIVPAFTFPSTANAFLAAGATVRFADVDLTTCNVDPASVEAAMGPRTAAVVTLHYGGVASDVPRLSGLCDATGTPLVEDAAHSLFGSFNSIPLGRVGRIAAFSFHRTKNISAVEGGALVINDPALIDAARILLDKGTNRAEFEAGITDSYEWCGFGSAWRMPAPIIDILDASLSNAATIQSRRHDVWNRYHTELASWATAIGASLPVVPDRATHPAHLFWVRLPEGADRDDLVRHCDESGIEVARHFGSLPSSRYGRQITDPRDRCPNAGILERQLVRLPLHHILDEHDVDRVIDAVASWHPGQHRGPAVSFSTPSRDSR